MEGFFRFVGQQMWRWSVMTFIFGAATALIMQDWVHLRWYHWFPEGVAATSLAQDAGRCLERITSDEPVLPAGSWYIYAREVRFSSREKGRVAEAHLVEASNKWLLNNDGFLFERSIMDRENGYPLLKLFVYDNPEKKNFYH